jgi:exodeoxyribonuclease VII small subunit
MSAKTVKRSADGGNDRSFEKSLKRLEEIVETIEGGTVSLDEVMKMYEEGVEISKACLEQLSQAEVKLKRLTKDAEGNFELFDERVEKE